MDATMAATATATATGSTGTGSIDHGQHDGEQQQQRDTSPTTTSMNAPKKAMSAPTNTGNCSAPDAGDTSLIVHPHLHPRSHSTNGNGNANANANANGDRPHHYPHPHPQHQLTAHSNGASTGAGQVKFGIGSEDTSMLELFPVLGVSQGGRLKIDWETEKEPGLAIRPEESLFDLVHKSSRFTELVLGGKSIAAALGLLHSGTRLLDSENAARRSMSPLESKMYEAWKNGATLPSLAGLSPLTTPISTMHRDRLSKCLVPEEKQRALALGQLYKLPDGQGVSLEQLQAFERQYPQLLPLFSARCKVLSVDDDAGVLRSDRVAAECLALRKTISMMDGALNDIVAMIANAVQTVNETSELLRARLEGLTLGTAPCEIKDSYATHQDFTGSDYHHPRGRVEEHPEAEERVANGVYVNNGTCDERMIDDDDHDGHHRTSETGHDHLEEDNVIEDDAMSEDQEGAAESQIRSSSPTAQYCSSGSNGEGIDTDGAPTSNEAQKDPASEVSDTERVERLLSEPPEGSAQAQGIDVHHQDSSVASPKTTHGAPTEAIPVPRRPETGSVTGFMSLGKKPTLALLPEMADTSSSSALRGPTGDAHSSPDDAAVGRTTKVVALGEEGGTSGKSLPFAPAGSSGRGSTPFVIAGRKE